LTTNVLAQNSRDHVSYYLRASARCEIGYQTRDKQMLRDGISDSREALRYGGSTHKLYYIPYIYGMTKLAEIEGKKSHAETADQVATQTLERPDLTAEEKSHLLYQRAGARVFLEKYDEAIADFDAAIVATPNLTSAYIGRAEADIRAGRPEKARESYDKMVAALPTQAVAYDYRGVFLQQQGRVNEAIADFNRAVQIDPRYHSAYTNRGFSYLASGQPQKAEADFSAALRILPQEPMLYSLRGSARLAQGRAREAVDDQRQAVTLAPNFPSAHADYGFALYFAGRLNDALTSFEKAQQLDPNMRHIDAWRYVVLTLLQRADDAKKLTDAALAKDAKDRDWVDNVLAFQGGGIDADQLLAAVSIRDPAGAEAQLCEAHFYIGMQKKLAGDAKGAEEHFQKTLETRADRLSAYRGAQFELKKFGVAAKST